MVLIPDALHPVPEPCTKRGHVGHVVTVSMPGQQSPSSRRYRHPGVR